MDLHKSEESFDSNDVAANKVAAVLAYFGVLVVVTMIIAPNSKYARYHANQGVCLLITGVVFMIAKNIVQAILGVIPIIGGLAAGLFTFAGSIVILALAIIGIMNAAKGEAKELPFIGQFQLLK